MKLFLPLLLSLGLTGCVDLSLPDFGEKKDKPTAAEKIQENKSEAELAQKEYEDLQHTRTSQ